MKTVLGRVSVLAVAGLLCCWAGPASANLVVNGNFETGSYTNFTGWTLTFSAVDLTYMVGPPVGIPTTQVQTGQWVAAYLDKACAVFGGIQDPVGDTLVQTITTIPGTNYYLTFWVNDNGNGIAPPGTPAKLAAGWNGTDIISLNWPPLAVNSTWTKYSAIVTGTGSDALQFAGYGFDGWTSLDNVSLDVVPEPASLGFGDFCHG